MGDSSRKRQAYFNSLSKEDQRKCEGKQSERSMRLRLCVDHVAGTNDAICLLCSTEAKPVKIKAFTIKNKDQCNQLISFDTTKVTSHLFSSCSQAGLLKLVEIAITDRGTRDNSIYLASNKRQKLDDDAKDKEEQSDLETQEVLDAIEELVIDTLPETFDCWCGQTFEKKDTCRFRLTLKAHFTTHCSFFKTWRQHFLQLNSTEEHNQYLTFDVNSQSLVKAKPSEQSNLKNLSECTPFGNWKNKSKKAVYYVHLWRDVSLNWFDLFLKQVVSYHGSVVENTRKNPFLLRFNNHKADKTIDNEREDIVAILTGSDESIHLIEALALVTFHNKCEIKNACVELLPLLGRSKEKIEAGFRSLLLALRHLFNDKVSKLPESQLQSNRQQYIDEEIQKLLSRKI